MSVLFSLFIAHAQAQHISIYDSVTDEEKAVVEVSCHGKDYKLLVKKEELEGRDVERWVSFILRTKCK